MLQGILQWLKVVHLVDLTNRKTCESVNNITTRPVVMEWLYCSVGKERAARFRGTRPGG